VPVRVQPRFLLNFAAFCSILSVEQFICTQQPPRLTDMSLWPFAVYLSLVGFITAAMLVLSWVLGQRHHDRSTDSPYESGIVSEGSARVRFSAKFYLVAMFFVIFDLEAVFLYAWAVSVRETGWTGYCEVLIFIGVLAATLAYLWRVGALDWGWVRPTGSRTR